MILAILISVLAAAARTERGGTARALTSEWEGVSSGKR